MSGLVARLESIEADITTLPLDAIVNAANEALIRGGGVDGAIRRKAGTEIEKEIRAIGRCPTGEAVITRGYLLPAKFVIHTVAPVYAARESKRGEQDSLLAACYRNALALAAEHDLRSVAFPCIGTGIYGWPAEHAAKIAFAAVLEHLRAQAAPERVTFCSFQAEDRKRYAELIAALANK